MESLVSLRALLVASRPKSWNLGYPPAVRARVAAYVTARREAGVRMDAIAEELGVSRHSAVAWSRSLPAPEQPMQFVPVELVAEQPALERQVLRSSLHLAANSAGRPTGVLVSPRGFRVEGLGVEALGVLLERLG